MDKSVNLIISSGPSIIIIADFVCTETYVKDRVFRVQQIIAAYLMLVTTAQLAKYQTHYLETYVTVIISNLRF